VLYAEGWLSHYRCAVQLERAVNMRSGSDAPSVELIATRPGMLFHLGYPPDDTAADDDYCA
jgi:hypothetical protein